MSTLKKNTLHPVQCVFLPAAETDTVGCVERSMSFNEVITLKASHALQSVNILIDHKHINANIFKETVEGTPVFLIPVSSIASGVLYPSATS